MVEGENKVTKETTETVDSKWGKETALRIAANNRELVTKLGRPDEFLGVLEKIKGVELTDIEKSDWLSKMEKYQDYYKTRSEQYNSARAFGLTARRIKAELQSYIAETK